MPANSTLWPCADSDCHQPRRRGCDPTSSLLAHLTAAVHDVWPKQIADRCAERVHQPGERPQGEQHQADQHVQLVVQRRLGHQITARLQHPDGAEPHRHRLAVVVSFADDAGPQRRGIQTRDERQHQHDVHDLVVDGGSHEHRSGGAPPEDQQRDADQRADPGDRSEHHGLHVVGLMAQPDRVGPGLRDEQADDMAEHHNKDAEMEHRAADPQQP